MGLFRHVLDELRLGVDEKTSFDEPPAPRLPKMILPMPNKDKDFHEHWYPGRDELDIIHPFRIVLMSKPNAGKTTVMKNILARIQEGKTPFERIIVVHCDAQETHEYDDLDCVLCSHVPSPQDISPSRKTLIILEDLNYQKMDRFEDGDLERLFGYASTHKNVSCMLTAQNAFSIPAHLRRCANVFVVWHNRDADMLKMLGRKIGLGYKDLCRAIDRHCQDEHDSLWVDFTTGTPMRFRKNGYEALTLDDLK